MASQLRVNKSENRSGLGTITYTDTGAIVSGIVTANSFSGDVIGDITGAVTATTGSFSGDVSIAEKIIHTGDTNTFMKFDTDTVTFETAGDERFRIKSDGVVNIGDRADNTWIDSTLKVRKDQNAVTKVAVRNENQGSSASSAIAVNAYGNSWLFDCGSAAKNSNALTIRVDATASSNQGTEKLRITTAGLVGIGLTNPGAVVHAYHATSNTIAQFESGDAGAVVVLKDNATYSYVEQNGNDFIIHADPGATRAASALSFKIDGNERLRISNAGLVSINSTSYEALKITTTENGNNGPEVQLIHNSASPAANDCIGQLRFSGKDSAGNTDLMSRIETIIDDPTSGQESAHLNFATRGYAAFNTILRLKARGTASAPSYTTDDMNGIILDTYNTGNPYPRYFNFIAKSAGNTDSNIGFWTESVGGSPTEKLRITSDGFVGINEDDPQTKLAVRGTITSGRNVAREVGSIIDISTQYSVSRGGANVINGNKNYEAGEDWLTPGNNRVNAKLTIDLGAQYNCDRFVIYNQNEYQDSNREVKNFTLEGSNDNSSWTTILDDDCGVSGAHEPNPGFSFRIPASYYDDSEGASYRYWRFTMKSFHGGGNGGHGGVMELELYEHTTTIHCTSEISTSSVVAGDMTAETLQGIKRLYASKGMNVYTGGATDTWEITEYGIVPSGSYQNKSTIRHKRGVMAVSSSYNTGDLYVRIDNLYNLPGNAWWVCGVFILSNEIAGTQAGSHHYVTSLQLMGIGTWNSVSKTDIVGSMTVSVAASGSNYVELFINVNDSSRGPCTVIATGPFDPPSISFA